MKINDELRDLIAKGSNTAIIRFAAPRTFLHFKGNFTSAGIAS
jgi:hypothetical protein